LVKLLLLGAQTKEDVVANDGKVTRGEDNATVTLTATIKVNKQEDSKTFELTV